MSFIIRVLVLIASDVATAIGDVLAASDSFAFAGIVESLLAAASVLGSVGQSSDCLSGFGA